jgi:flagellar basal-body rod protein FlgB
MSDPTMNVLYGALNGLMARQDAIANNVANVNTPGYTAENVDFEDALRSAIADGSDPSNITPTVTPSTDPANANGNNVDLGEQTMSLSDTELRYQAVVDAVNAKFQLLSTAIGAFNV